MNKDQESKLYIQNKEGITYSETECCPICGAYTCTGDVCKECFIKYNVDNEVVR